MTGIPFLQAKYYRKGRDGKRPIWIVLHTVEAKEGPNTAEAVARYFQNPPRVGSSHYVVDCDSVVQCVHESDQAAGAAGANRQGLHIEHAGFAGQSAAEWADDYSMRMLRLSAGLCADLCRRYDIPAVWLSAEDLLAGKRGVTGHATCTKAFGGTHWDPGPHFPAAEYLGRVREAMGEGSDLKRIRVFINQHEQTDRVKSWLEGGNSIGDYTDLWDYFGWPKPEMREGILYLTTPAGMKPEG